MGCDNSKSVEVDQSKAPHDKNDKNKKLGKYKLKLVYFPARGRAEIIRLLLAQAGAEYEDVRINPQEDWPNMKKDMPYGQLPVLEVDGQKLAQSNTIARLVAREAGLTGKKNIDVAQVDSVNDTFDDLYTGLVQIKQTSDETEKGELSKKFKDEDFPTKVKGLEKILSANKGGDGYFVGSDVTLADLKAYQTLYEVMKYSEKPELLDDYPKLKGLYQRVENLPRIKTYLEKRPETDN